MRSFSLLIAAAILASCTTAPPQPGPPIRTASGQRTFDRLLGGRVAGQPISCLPNYNINNVTNIDGRTIAFGAGPGTVYLVHLTPGCELIDNGPYAILSKQSGGLGLCRGDIQNVIDTMSRTQAGSCTVAEIIPYTRP